jgi:hypothetical protein
LVAELRSENVRVLGAVTAVNAVVPLFGDERFDPHRVAEAFLGVHGREPHEWVAEVIHS